MKRTSLILFFLTLTIAVFGQDIINKTTTQNITNSGIGLGSVIAVVISWDKYKSIGWAILHGIFGWLYVIYYAFTRDNK